jgi:CRP-like cAMP-binding protein
MSATPRPELYPDLDYLGGASAYADEVYEVISKGPIFEEFSHQEIEVICQFMHCYAAPRDAVLLQEGEEGDYLLVVLSGKVEVRKFDLKGQPLGIATVGPGNILGEMSLFDGEHRFATCSAVVPTDFAVMTRADLNELLLLYSRLANKLLIKMIQIMVGRMRDTGLRLVENLSAPIV